MGMAVSLLLIAVGAIMRFAVTADASGFNIGTAGVVLMIVGGIGLVLSIIFWSSWGGFHRGDTVAVAQPVTTTHTHDPRA
ncbi:MAG: hypothetical protein Q7K25_09875 [Actinomycetota bacterium]|nr:hypothetical protein [Actinomycetota bacterium]